MKIIAEVGCNHTSMEEAYQFIKESKRLGLFATKFQLFSKEMAQSVKVPEYLSLSKVDAMELYDYGHCIGQEVFFTPMDVERVGWCENIGVNYIKVRHKDNSNRELYNSIKKTKKFTFISINEYNDLWQNFIDYKRGIFLYVIPKYPAKIEDYLIPHKLIHNYQGISDHTPDTRLLKLCKAFKEIEYFEIHVKLDNTEPLEDKWSVSFSELAEVLK